MLILFPFLFPWSYRRDGQFKANTREKWMWIFRIFHGTCRHPNSALFSLWWHRRETQSLDNQKETQSHDIRVFRKLLFLCLCKPHQVPNVTPENSRKWKQLTERTSSILPRYASYWCNKSRCSFSLSTFIPVYWWNRRVNGIRKFLYLLQSFKANQRNANKRTARSKLPQYASN